MELMSLLITVPENKIYLSYCLQEMTNNTVRRKNIFSLYMFYNCKATSIIFRYCLVLNTFVLYMKFNKNNLR